MVRAATWLHFGSGGSCGLRVSTTVTSTPRQARSMASVRPTGPAPTIKTLQSRMSSLFCCPVANHNSDPDDIAKGTEVRFFGRNLRRASRAVGPSTAAVGRRHGEETSLQRRQPGYHAGADG